MEPRTIHDVNETFARQAQEYQSGNYKKLRIYQLESAYKGGDPYAALELGDRYRQSPSEVEKDLALDAYRNACKLLQNRVSTAKDTDAEKLLPQALVRLGDFYAEKDDETDKALTCYENAAELDESYKLYLLNFYRSGKLEGPRRYFKMSPSDQTEEQRNAIADADKEKSDRLDAARMELEEWRDEHGATLEDHTSFYLYCLNTKRVVLGAEQYKMILADPEGEEIAWLSFKAKGDLSCFSQEAKRLADAGDPWGCLFHAQGLQSEYNEWFDSTFLGTHDSETLKLLFREGQKQNEQIANYYKRGAEADFSIMGNRAAIRECRIGLRDTQEFLKDWKELEIQMCRSEQETDGEQVSPGSNAAGGVLEPEVLNRQMPSGGNAAGEVPAPEVLNNQAPSGGNYDILGKLFLENRLPQDEISAECKEKQRKARLIMILSPWVSLVISSFAFTLASGRDGLFYNIGLIGYAALLFLLFSALFLWYDSRVIRFLKGEAPEGCLGCLYLLLGGWLVDLLFGWLKVLISDLVLWIQYGLRRMLWGKKQVPEPFVGSEKEFNRLLGIQFITSVVCLIITAFVYDKL